ncbi:MAG: helix-turn-helix domain-containing protein [Bacteroidota bacterium]
MLLLSFCAFTPNQSEETSFEQAKEHLIMRQIGHQVLLQAGDSSSRVLPVQKIGDAHYQIHFESPFSFQPEVLVRTIDTVIQTHAIEQDYIVNVRACAAEAIVYSYAIFRQSEEELAPCNNRQQAKNCYFIELQFAENTTAKTGQYAWRILGGLLGLACCVYTLYWWRKDRAQSSTPAISTADQMIIPIGSAHFYPEEQYLNIDGTIVKLTPTESKLLLVFATSPNQVLEKASIQKEVWNHDAAIVSRSLDVFVSKLRKKLSRLEGVQLVNVPSRGYRLEIED